MRLALTSVLLLLFSLATIGQTNKGSITGSVSDPQGAAVPGATVTITNVLTQVAIKVETSKDGIYVAHNLEPALYDVTIEAANFKKAVVEKVKVDTASSATVNVGLELGNVAEQVTITADLQMVNADSGTISQTITERQLRDLPLNNRSVLDLAVTMPNVSGDTGSEDVDAGFSTPMPGFNLSVNGGRPGSTTMLADGVNNTGVGLARAVVSFSPETVQEFAVQSSAYSAEFGTTGGGVINITTKSGAKDFFGTALWYHRNPKTNARAWNQGSAPRPANNLRSNQLSFTVGGPMFLPNLGEGVPSLFDGRKRGSFFFFAVEPRWRNDFTQGVGLVPTDAEKTGNFRDMRMTPSGWLPANVANQYYPTGLLPANDPSHYIYQQFTINAAGQYVPIIVPAVAGNQYCPYGSVATLPGGVPGEGYSVNSAGQPYCTTAQALAQINNRANNPNLNVIPAAFMDPIAVQLMQNMNPAEGYFLDNGLVRNLFTLREAEQNETRLTLRLDHNFTDKIKGTFRWTKTPAVGIRAATGSDINGNTGVYSDAEQYLFTLNNIITSNMSNEARFNYTQGSFSEDFSPEFSIMGGRNFSSELGIASLTSGGMPLMQISTNDNQYAAPDIGSGLSTNNFNKEKRYDFSDTFFWTKGNMTWKIGGNWNMAKLAVTPFFAASGGRWQFRRLQTNNSPAGVPNNNNLNNASNGGNSLASMLIGVPNVVAYRPVLFNYDYQWDSYAAFVQNDWKVRSNLTLNLGLRYAVQRPRTEEHNQQGVFRPDLAVTQNLTEAQRRAIATAAGVLAANPIPTYVPTTASIVPFAFSGEGGRSRHIVKTDWNGWEPRLGFAWSPKGLKIFGYDLEKRSFVIRGGFGISHAPINGNNRNAFPDFGGFTEPGTIKPTTAAGSASTGTQFPLQPFRLSGNNPIQGSSQTLNQLLGTDANGLVFNKAVVIPGIAVDINDPNYGKVPIAQNWNVAVQWELFKDSTLEVAYVGNRGVHLFTPQININQRDIDTIGILTANNINPTANVADPLQRTPLLGGTTAIQTQIASLFSQYMGYEPLNKYFNANSSSIRHAVYFDFRRRVSRGLSFTANYTYAKSFDDSSDASPDVRVLTSGSVRGQVALGGNLDDDWAPSAFDTRHAFSSTFTWDLPFGKGRQWFSHAPWYVNGPLGGWVLSGVARVVSGNPFQPFITDPNLLGGAGFNRVVRPDLVEGVPLKNPLWDPGCRVGSAGTATGGGCEPYVNPAAFMRPPKGHLGNSPRTLSITEPMRSYFDLSIQKDFPMPWISDEGRRRINFRIDAINVFNMPNFYFNSRGNTPFGFGTFPVEFNGAECIGNVSIPTPTTGNCSAGTRPSVITAGEYDAWAAFNGQPASGTPAGAVILGQIRSMVNGVRLPERPGQPAGAGALPDAFYSIQVPEGFATRNSLAYDIRTLDGFKLWRLRNNYDGNFGSLTSGAVAFGSPNPGTSQRYIQFGIRLIF
ncbi:MAG TPA: carboxypeptidase regulatory-like domain-containing protein [Pyrinomonadaceae bacterium]|nr:carboxypeptidase regulatory-like domain-containing protein [Pyrinomonadaceae bacterium]